MLLLVAAGIILPMMFHAVGMGKVFLPMHIPVLLAGFMVGPIIGGLVGFLTPAQRGLDGDAAPHAAHCPDDDDRTCRLWCGHGSFATGIRS